jgi:hypothetical protein
MSTGPADGIRRASSTPQLHKETSVKPALILLFAATTCVVVSLPAVAGHPDDGASPIYGVRMPAGYREWQMIAPSQEAGKLDELRVILGNPTAMKAFRNGKLPFPDGTILAKLAWKRVPSIGDDGALGAPQAFVPSVATTAQFMIKDSKKYATSGGWGFGRFIDGKPVDRAQHETCFACHEANARGHDMVFTQYAAH